VSRTGGTVTVTVQTASACSWSVQNSLNWVTVTGGNSGAGNGSVTLQVAPNPLIYSRAAAIFVAGQMVVITQDGGAPPVAPSGFRIVQ
jgi:hypothetical protein